MQSSTRQTPRYSGVAEWTAQSTEQQGLICLRSVARWAVARPATRKSPEAIGSLPVMSFTPWVRCGTVGTCGEAALLASCYRRSLEIARENGLRSIGFPSISTGVYGYPLEEATAIAINSVGEFVDQNPSSCDEVVFCCFSSRDLEVYRELLEKISASDPP